MENSGFLALLQRGTKKVIWVTSSYCSLNSDYDLVAATPETFDPEKAGVSVDLYDKFGYGYATKAFYYTKNQVFAKQALLPLVRQMASLKKDGKPIVLRVQLEVEQNGWWGIQGGRSVDIIFVYLQKVADFEKSLPSDTQDEINKEEDGAFPGYPIYATGLANLKACQVNLLAAQAEYCVRERQDEFLQFCK